MAFEPKTLDYDLSPYTGLTRQSWIEAGIYLMEGIFQHIKDFEDPIVMPRKETEITYPHLKASKEQQAVERKAEIFEGLTRSMFIAAPLIHDNPELTVCGYKLREYYKNQILRICMPKDEMFIGYYEDQQRISGTKDPFRTFQQTVETCALVICLWVSKAEIWDTYTKSEKDTIAKLLDNYAHANTVPQNWRLFNMLDMAFLHMEGYPIDHDIMLDHAQEILSYYVGDGWYRDGHSFDYYSCWAFNVYAPIWNLWYGYEHVPYIAAQFEEHSNKLMETYGDFFDRDGFTNMWGRSNIYRNAATSAFDGNLMLKNYTMNPGLARRISSGSLMQFLGREDFLYKGIPTLGFYGQFAPLVQGYSCAESPFWLGKAFLCLHLPAEHPFWTEKENNGSWETLEENETKVTTLNGPALCFSNHQANGETILRTGKVVKQADDRNGMWNYSKLSFNSKYPWEACPREDVESQQYVLKDITTGNMDRANVTYWHGEKDGVLYRRQFFDYQLSRETHWIQAMNLADFAVPYGIVRADKMRFHRRPVALTLGSYGFPDNGTTIERKECSYEIRGGEQSVVMEICSADALKNAQKHARTMGEAQAIILKGHDATGQEKQLAMTIYEGFEELSSLNSVGTNPDSEKSIVIYASLKREKQYGYEPYFVISQTITKESSEDFAEDEIFPIAAVEYADAECCGGYGSVILHMKNGGKKVIDFAGIEGNLQR